MSEINENMAPMPASDAMIGSMKANTYCMLLHLSQLLGVSAVPVLGWAVPIIMWVLKKDQYPQVDRHGKIALNWIISSVIYGAIAGVLCFILIGIPLLLALWALGIIFPIIGAIRANDGVEWPYPLSIKFFKV